VDRPDQRANDNRGKHNRELEPDRNLPGYPGNHDDQEWPHEIELFFHRERPEVLQWGRWQLGAEVIRALLDEAEVTGEQGCPACILGRPVASDLANERVRCEHRRHDDDRRRREQASSAACVEPGNRHASVAGDFAQQEARDQEPGQHEEHIDPDVPAAERTEPGMVEHDHQDRNCAQTLDVRAKFPLLGDVCGLLALNRCNRES
jgi:hypothetical protein